MKHQAETPICFCPSFSLEDSAAKRGKKGVGEVFSAEKILLSFHV